MVWLEEWMFDFIINGGNEAIPYRTMEELLSLEIVPWAEKHGLGIGGGFRPKSEAFVDNLDLEREWRFKFGLCIQQEGHLIPITLAQELFDLIIGWCQTRCYGLTGCFR